MKDNDFFMFVSCFSYDIFITLCFKSLYEGEVTPRFSEDIPGTV